MREHIPEKVLVSSVVAVWKRVNQVKLLHLSSLGAHHWEYTTRVEGPTHITLPKE